MVDKLSLYSNIYFITNVPALRVISSSLRIGVFDSRNLPCLAPDDCLELIIPTLGLEPACSFSLVLHCPVESISSLYLVHCQYLLGRLGSFRYGVLEC